MKTKIDFLTKLNKLHNNESLALGLYVEGLNLRAVWLEKKQEQVRILGAENIVLPHSLESDLAEEKPSKQKSTSTSKINAEDIQAELEKIDTIDPDLETVEKPTDTIDEDLTDVTSDIKIEYLPDRKTEGETYNGFSIIRDILNRYPNRKLRIAVSIPEPQLYYSHFETNWGLSGKRLNRRIVEELMKQKPGSEVIKPEMMHNLNLNDESFITITRDSEIGLLNILARLRGSLNMRMPQISVVESAEISLINLVKGNYHFREEEISVIVYVGNEFSRLIFMQGNKLIHIAPIISEGIELLYNAESVAAELAKKIRSRLMLEQDNLNIAEVQNIILTGEACRKEFQKSFVDWFDKDVNIEAIRFPSLENVSGNRNIMNELPQYATAVGAAWRAIESSKNSFYDVDLIPFKIREEQKVLKLGAIGWTLLMIIPVLTFLFTLKISQMEHKCGTLETALDQKKYELAYLQDINQKVEIKEKKYNYYVNAFGVLDSLVIGTYSWSSFLNEVTLKAEGVGNIWITDIYKLAAARAMLRGYAMDRKKIPAFCDSLTNSVLKQVQIQEINNKTVFSFEVETDVKEQRPEFDEEAEFAVSPDSTATAAVSDSTGIVGNES